MAISLQCACGRSLRLKDHLAGKRVKCPDCNSVLEVPQPDVVEDAVVDDSIPEVEEAPPPRSQSYRPNYEARRPAPPAPPKTKRRRRSRPRLYPDRRGGGISISPAVITGLLMMVVAVVWLIAGLLAGLFFYGSPILFVLGLICFVKGLMGYEED